MALNDEILNSLLNLDFNDIRDMNPNWSDTMVNDYVYKQQNINSIVTVTVSVEDQVTQNTADIATITPVVTQNVTDINTNEGNIATNATNLSNHIGNTSGAHAASAISYDNTASGLAAVSAQEGIDEVDANLDTHISATDAHGVTGVNIGTEDFAQT